jgi:hypothetical protein
MECSDEIHDDEVDVSVADEPPATTPKYMPKPPKKKKKFGRANYGLDVNSKRRRTGRAAVPAPAAAADATPSPSVRNQERKEYPSQQIQKLTKKSGRLYDECTNLTMQLKDSETEKNRLQQPNNKC